MTANFFDGKKGRSLDNIIAKLSRVKTSRKGNRILLVSERNNACLSLSSEDSDDGEADLHQCGTCRQMFVDLSNYIIHKIEKPCRAGLAVRESQWNNDVPSFTNDVDVDDNTPGKESKNSRIEQEKDTKGPNHESQKRKHDRKGLARRLNVAGSPDSENASISPVETKKIGSDGDDGVCENESPVIVVVSEPSVDYGVDTGPHSRIVDTNNEQRETEISMHRTLQSKYSPKNPNTSIDARSSDMPFLERIPNYTHDRLPLYSAPGLPNFPPRITDKMQTGNHGNANDIVGDGMVSEKLRQRFGHENHMDVEMRKSWSNQNRKGFLYPSHGEGDMHGYYHPHPPAHLYSSHYSSLPYTHQYMRYSNASQFNKPYCSAEPPVHPSFLSSHYATSSITSDKANSKVYEKDPVTFLAPYSNSKTVTSLSHNETRGADFTRQRNSDQAESSQQLVTISEGNPMKPLENEQREAEIKDEINNRAENEDKEVGNGDESLQDERSNEASVRNASDVPPQLVRIASLNSKENLESPSSSLRPESFESNSQAGSLRSRDSTPTSASDSPLSSSNLSLDPTISPSQAYDGGSLRLFNDAPEGVSKQSMESDSSVMQKPEKTNQMDSNAQMDDNACERSLSVTEDDKSSNVPERRPDSIEADQERPDDVSSPPSDPSWRHSKQVYRCPLCAKIFPFKSKLQRHVLVHTGIKPYKCTVCGRGFTQQIDLQRHLTRHTGEKPFKCHLCKAQFIRADNLRKHAKDTHFVNIEEPIRKRRRKTTGSDTVLPPLEVAIAMAINETEKNGGRVLGRSTSRGGRTSRRDRLMSMEEDHRRMEQSAETFSRPTMGSVPSHQYPTGPPSMGFPPHGPGVAPYTRYPMEYPDPLVNERPMTPPHHLPHIPSRYHPGSMVFQPRPGSDRFMDRPYLSRPPNDPPGMYWTSPTRHSLGAPGDGQRMSERERYNSETSEGACSVFEGRDPGKPSEEDRDMPPRCSESLMGARAEIRPTDDRMVYLPDDRSMRVTENRGSAEKLMRTQEEIAEPITGSSVPNTPAKRIVFSSEMSDHRPQDLLHYSHGFNRSPHDRSGERMHQMEDGAPRNNDDNVFLLPEEPRRQDEKTNLSPPKVTSSVKDERLSIGSDRFEEANSRMSHVDVETDQGASDARSEVSSKDGAAMAHHRVPDGWSRYDKNNLDSSPIRISPSKDENHAVKSKRDINNHQEEKNSFRTLNDELRIISS